MGFRLKCYNWIGFLIATRSIEENEKIGKKEKFIATIEICTI